MKSESVFLYVVRSADGKYFRSKGLGGSRTQWVDSLARARVYGTKAPASGVVAFYRNHSDRRPPVVVRLKATVDAEPDAPEKVAEALPPFKGCEKSPYDTVFMTFGRKRIAFSAQHPNAYAPVSGRRVKLNKALVASALPMVAAILSGGPAEPFADWIRENWVELIGGER